MMFTIRPYTEKDAAACGECLYEGFFTAPVEDCDKILLRDYAQVLIEKCNFTYVAEADDRQVVGFICGKYSKSFDRPLANRYACKKHYGLWCRMFFKYYLKQYKMSGPFQIQWDHFFSQLQERDSKTFGTCDLELVALASKAAYRKGLGTALVTQFLSRARDDGNPSGVEKAARVEQVWRHALGLGGFDRRSREVDPWEGVDRTFYSVTGHSLQAAECARQGL